MSRRGWMWLTGLVTAAVIALVLWLPGEGSVPDVPENVAGPAGGEQRRSAGGGAAERSGREGAGGAEATGAGAGEGTGAAGIEGRSRREWLERAIRVAREERLARREGGATAAATGRAPGGGADEPGSLDPEYVRAAIQELKPLLRECYELAQHEQADLEGRLVVQFEIVGEPDVGGIVDTSGIDESSDLRHPTLDECVRETMYTAELPAPEGGGRVTVRYPFVFSPE